MCGVWFCWFIEEEEFRRTGGSIKCRIISEAKYQASDFCGSWLPAAAGIQWNGRLGILWVEVPAKNMTSCVGNGSRDLLIVWKVILKENVMRVTDLKSS